MKINIKATTLKNIDSINYDKILITLSRSTDAQIETWLLNNLNSMSDARAILSKILKIVRYIINKEAGIG